MELNDKPRRRVVRKPVIPVYDESISQEKEPMVETSEPNTIIDPGAYSIRGGSFSVYYGFDLKGKIVLFDKYQRDYNSLVSLNTTCFSSYRYRYPYQDECMEYFVGFTGWEFTLDVIEELNQLFKHIKFEVVRASKFVSIPYHGKSGGYSINQSRYYHEDNVSNIQPTRDSLDISIEWAVIIKIKYIPDEDGTIYSKNARQFLSYVLGVFLRNMDIPGEGYMGRNFRENMILLSRKEITPLELVIKETSNHGGHGTYSYKLTKEEFKMLDDIKLVEEIIRNYKTPTQDGMFKGIQTKLGTWKGN